MRYSVIVLLAILCLAIAVQAREPASRSERRAAERARAAAEEGGASKSTPPPPPPPKAAPKAASNDDDDDDEDTDDDDSQAGSGSESYTPPPPPPPPSAPVDPDLEENWKDLDEMTSLWRAVSSGDLAQLNSMLEQFPQIARLRSADGRSGLFWAYEYEQPEMVELLLARGARADVKDRNGVSPKQMAPAPGSRSAAAAAAGRNKPTDFTSCGPCTAAGFGWDTSANRCSSTSSNKICPDDDDDDDNDEEEMASQ